MKSVKEWEQYCKSASKRPDIPWKADRTYRKEWISWGDWLGTNRIADQNKVYRPFVEAKKLVHSFKLKSGEEWKQYCKSGKKPEDIPSNPDTDTIYKKNWTDWGDWLGTGRVADQYKTYRDFSNAREFVRSLMLKNKDKWMNYCKSIDKPEDIPVNPRRTYGEYWKGWGDWLGTSTIAGVDRIFLSFEEAREIVHKLRLKNQAAMAKLFESR